MEHRQGGPRDPGDGPPYAHREEGRARRADVHRGRVVRRARLPLEEVFDPTGAGDTFAGGFVGYLAGAASAGGVDDVVLRRAVIMGSTLASFCVEAFSLDRLIRLTRAEIDDRYRLFKRLTHFESV